MEGNHADKHSAHYAQQPSNTAAENRKWKRAFAIICAVSLLTAIWVSCTETKRSLEKSCASVARDFNYIMASYVHSFRLFEKYLQLEIDTAETVEDIEAFLKKQDKSLLAIEGEDYDGVYLYYQGRYLYSWDTPYSVYEDSGYDATTRPWYIGAVAAEGEVFFSVPYISYANDYMLATISRLQSDGETVIAYDIKLGEIGKFVKLLDIYNGSLTFICDAEGNIIGSTNDLYQGGNYLLSESALQERIAEAERMLAQASDNQTKAARVLEATKAQAEFARDEKSSLIKLREDERSLHFHWGEGNVGYAYTEGAYTCFVLVPMIKLLPNIAVAFAALAFVLTLLLLLVSKMLRRNNLIAKDALTGLNNRRSLMKYCNDHVDKHPEDELHMIMLDLNRFKEINDKWGHVVGDYALLDAAEVLKKACQRAKHDVFLCRYGGDEFLLVGTACSQKDTEQMIAMVKEGLAEKNKAGSNPYTLEISIGVSQGKCKDGRGIEQLLEQADRAMYQDKLRMKAVITGEAVP